MEKRKIIMDVDTGIDDAIALFLVAGSPELDLLGITVAAGNQTLDKTLKNTLKVSEMLQLKIPVAKGAGGPFLYDSIIAEDTHGEGGLGLFEGNDPNYPLSELSAVQLMEKIVGEADGKITLLPTGPLTNIATFLLANPHLKEKIDMICLMGGGALKGNKSITAEFNFLADPEAAHIVFKAGIPIIMCGLDVTHQAYITREEIDKLVSNDSEIAKAAKDMLDFYHSSYLRRTKLPGAPLHDSVAAAYLIAPELFGGFDAYVEIDLEGDLTRGASITDGLNLLGKESNAYVVNEINREKLIELTIERFDKLINQLS